MCTSAKIVLTTMALLLFCVFNICQAATISGNITNGTGAPISGRLYLMLDNTTYGSTGYGTSIAVSGVAAGATIPYELRGVRAGTYTVRAFLDTRNTGAPYGESPVGLLTPVAVATDGATVTGQNFGLGSQGSQTLGMPNITAIPLDNGVLLFWDTVTNGLDIEIASHYNLYWSTTPNPGPGNTTGGGSKLNILSQNDGHAFIPLTNGNSYYFAVEAVLASATNSPQASVTADPVTIGPGAGGHTVTMTVNFDAPPAAPLLALVESDFEQWAGGAYIAAPTQSQLITIPGVPDGTYQMTLILDKNANGIYDTGDVNLSELDWRMPLINMAGADIYLGSRNMTVSRNLEASLTTERNLQYPSVFYGLNFQFYHQQKRPAHFTVSGPQLTTTDLGVNSWGEFWSYHPVPSAPTVGDQYAITVTYTDGTSESFNLSVSNVLTLNPTPTHPIGTTAPESVSPWFSWNTLTGIPNTPYIYRVMLRQANSTGDYLFESILPPDRTSVAYSGDALQQGTEYNWGIEMIDSKGNRAVSWSSFTPQASGPTITGISHFAMPCGDTTPITLNGTGFSSTPANNSIYLNNTQYPITPSSATVTSLTFQLPDCATTPSPTGPVIVKVSGQPAVGSHGEFTPTLTFGGSVVDSSNNPLSGATVELDATDPIATTTTAVDGSFQLAGIPTGRLYRLKVTAASMIPLYTAYMLHHDNTASAFPYTMFTGAYLTTWGNTAGKGIIRAKTRGDNGAEINGVTVTAFGSRNNTPYTVTYGNTCGSSSPLSDSSVFCVKDVEDGDWIKVTGTKPSAGLTFNTRIFQGESDAMGQSGLTAPVMLPLATSGSAMGFSFDGTNYLTGIENHLTSPTSIGAQMLSASGAQIGGLITTGRTGIATNSAFDGDNHLLIWEDDGLGTLNGSTGFQIYGQFIDRTGVKVGAPFAITTAGIWFDGMKVMAYGGGKYLVTYTRLINPALGDASTNRYIAGRIVNPDGTMGAEFRISTAYGDASDVAFDGTNFFVVWTEDQNDQEIRGRFVSTSGVPGTEVSVSASSAPSDNPKSVIFDGTNYLVVWSDEVSTDNWDVFAQKVNTSGSLVGSPFTITAETGPQMATSVSFDGTNYFVTWVDMTLPDNWNLYGQYFAKADGAAANSKMTLNANIGNQLGGAGFANGKYLVLINDGVIMGEGGITQVNAVYGLFRAVGFTPTAPTISSFSPGSGEVGTTVTINGANFVSGATSVSFNGVASTNVSYASSTQITATVPTGASTGPVVVTTVGITPATGSTFTVTVPVPAPTIVSFTGSGSVGDTITISGTNFIVGATAVSFNGTLSSTVNVTSATTLTAVVPVGATTGTISVTTAGGTAVSGTSFTVLVDRILTVSLASATYGTGKVTVTGQADCTVSPCTYTISNGSEVDLTPVPDVASGFAAWTEVSGTCDSIISNVCKVTMNADKSMTANFSLLQLKNISATTYHATLLAALTAASTGQEIRAHNSLQAPSLSYNRAAVTITVKGGYNNAFDQRLTTDFTDILYPLTIQNGTLILDQIIVK